MTLIELSFRNESVFMTKNDITGLTNEEWFLKTILEATYLSEEDNNNKIEINEDKNTAMSLIDSMRYNRLIVYPRVSMDYLLLLAEKWCIPENIIDMIHTRIDQNINVNNLDQAIHETPLFDEVDNLIFKCGTCSIGFKMSENKKDSCISHGIFNLNFKLFTCCGGGPGSKPCLKGYHCLNDFTLTKYLGLKKDSVNGKLN